MLVVGLTGGIGAGKTTVANLFAERGVPIVDTDLIAKQVTEKGQPALTDIVKHFGPSILLPDGSLNRSQLRDIIFHDAKQRHWLENKLHPLIKASMEAQIKTLKAPYCIAVIPLLFEVEFYSMINRILVVDAPEALQVERVIARDHLSKDQIKAILHNQANREDRVARAHDVIINDGDLQHLTLEVDALHQAYLKLSNK